MPFSHPDYLSEHARPGWPFVDSDLGESYESLANVQSPSWNHADFCGIRTNGYRVLAAVVLPRTIPLTLLKVTDYSIRFKPVARLTSALRSGGLATTSVAEATPGRSPGVSSTAFRAQPPNLRFAPLMDMDFAVSCPLVRRWRLISGFCPSTRTFVPCFLQTPPRGGSPCIITRPYLHQVDQRTFTSKLLSMPSTQRSRFAADAFACPEASDMEDSRLAIR